MSQANIPSHALLNTRLISASPREVFAAFEQADMLAKWWGPDGFTNTFQTFEFKPGGRWVHVMHGSNGANYPNESVFREIERDRKVVIEHVVVPWFTLTVTLAAEGGQTRLTWLQAFENAAVAEKMRPLAATANEQNLNRLEAVLAGHK